jgi:glycosyltransferase involved in cell wall biosynthesis
LTAHFVGDGPDKSKYLERIAKLGLEKNVVVHDAMPARKAFAMAKVVVVPSRAESMPYLVLEAAAAGKRIVATKVGGIPEIFQEQSGALVGPGNVNALAAGMRRALEGDGDAAARLRASVRERFSVERMAADIEAAYRRAH